MAADQLMAYRHEGFWACMDTLKDKQLFDDMHARGQRPWEVWNPTGSTVPGVPVPLHRNGAGSWSAERRVAEAAG
jgi:NDP-sugar pyrophosphorylase family protein